MISFEEAYQIVQDHSVDFGVESVGLNDAIGRVLREDWFTDRPMPPYDRVTMDGIAFNSEHYAGQKMHIENVAAAGSIQQALKTKDACIEVMTGAVLPKGCDTVIRYEDLRIADGFAEVIADVRLKRNIHRLGEDLLQNDQVAHSGKVIDAALIGVAATIGKSQIKVSKLPRVLVVSTGDELVNVDQQPLPHQIRKSNVYRILAALTSCGIVAESMHLNDEFESIKDSLSEVADQYDVLILSGGVSKGKFDFIPKVLEELGVQRLFHKVKQRPGKPFWFGKKKGLTVFALPGNPNSSFMCFLVYVMTWLRKSWSINSDHRTTAQLAQQVDFKPDLTRFLVADVNSNAHGVLLANPMVGNGSGNLTNLTRGNAFVKLNRGLDVYPKGYLCEVFYY